MLEINIDEEKELKLIQQSILQLTASLNRLGVSDIKLSIQRNDVEYLNRLVENNPNWGASKYCKVKSDDLLYIHDLEINGC